MQETTIKSENCKKCGTSFEITDQDLEFYKKVSPIFNNKIYKIPSPKICPTCRYKMRGLFRNLNKIYKRTCDKTGKSLISMYHQDSDFPVYHQDIWFEDSWNPMDYGQNFDFDKPFFEQFAKLMKKVPRPHISIHKSENTIYQNNAGFNKNCYLVFSAGYNDNCHYSVNIDSSNNCIDNLGIAECELCYECIGCKKSYELFFSQNCISCSHSSYLFDCQNCDNCIGCTGLRGKSYYIFNKQYTKDEFQKKSKELSKEDIISKYNKLKKQTIRINLEGLGNENSIGDFIYNSKNVYESYHIDNCENIKFSDRLIDSEDSYDILAYGYNLNMSYFCVQAGSNSSKMLFTNACFSECYNLIYCDICRASSNCFGCVGLKNKEYCIFNKQYTKDEYEKLVPQIIEHMVQTGEWGEFFPSSLSPFAYNESVNQEDYPLTKSEATTQGYKWKELEDKDYNGDVYIPLDISQYNPDIVGKEIGEKNQKEILNQICKCEVSGRPFRLIKPELDFYIKYNLEIPKKHPDIRHNERMALYNPRNLYNRNCDKCGKKIKTIYSSDRAETVYCQECYTKTIY